MARHRRGGRIKLPAVCFPSSFRSPPRLRDRSLRRRARRGLFLGRCGTEHCSRTATALSIAAGQQTAAAAAAAAAAPMRARSSRGSRRSRRGKFTGNEPGSHRRREAASHLDGGGVCVLQLSLDGARGMASRRPTQVIAGLANAQPQAVACGKPFGFPIVAYGSGSHVVLALAEARTTVLQEIAVDVDAVSCVAWSPDGTRLAACGHGSVIILEAARDSAASAACPFVWKIVAELRAADNVLALTWVRQGEREMLLSAGTEVALWHTAPPPPAEKGVLEEEDPDEERNYQRALESWARRLDRRFDTDESWCAWRSDCPVPACLAAASADGEAFATCGQFENQVKMYFRDKVLAPAAAGAPPVDDYQYLSHPDRVTGMAWNGGRGRSALLTCCADGLLRLWVSSRNAETVSFFPASTWPEQPGTSAPAAAWLVAPGALTQPGGDAHAPVDSPIGVVPNLDTQRDCIVQHREGGGLCLWYVDGLADKATEGSVRVSEPHDVASSGTESCSLQALHTLNVESAALDPYEKTQSPITGSLVGHGADGLLHLWDAGFSAGAPSVSITEGPHEVIGTKPAFQMVLCPDGSLAASCGSAGVSLWEVGNPILQFAAPRAAPLQWSCDVPVSGLTSVNWLPGSSVLAVAGSDGISLFSCKTGSMAKLKCANAMLEQVDCLSIAAFGGSADMQWTLAGLVQPTSRPGWPAGPKSLAVWSVTLEEPFRRTDPITSFSVEELVKEELPEGSGTAMACAPSTPELSSQGDLAEVLQNDQVDARKGPVVMFVGDESGTVTVYTLCEGEEEEEETEEMLIERAVAHFPEPKRTTMKSSLLKMPAGAREKAIEKFLAMAPGGGEPAPAVEGGDDSAPSFRLAAVCTLSQEGGAVTQIAVRDANRFAAVTSSGGATEMHMWTAEPASWPDFHLRRNEKRTDEEIVSVGWDLVGTNLQLAIALTDRLEILALESDLAWTSGSEDWKLTEMISENMQPITAVMWFHCHGLAVATEHHISAYFDVGVSSTQAEVVQPDYHPDQVEMLLFAGDAAREMLGRIARNAVSTAPEEWEPQKWRPPRTPLVELLGKDGAKDEAKESTNSSMSGLYSMSALTETGPADPMEKDAARQLSEKLKNKAQLLGISADQRVHLSAILDTHAQEIFGSLDASATRFLLRANFVRAMKERHGEGKHKFKKPIACELQSCDQIWAYHSETQDALLQAAFPAETTLPEMLQAGAPLWVRDKPQLEKMTMKVAMATYKKENNPDDCLLLYVAMKKTSMAVALYKAQKIEKLQAFLQNDFTQQKFQVAAKKNGFALMKKGRYEMAAAFLIIGGDVAAAVTVLTKNHKNPILALLVIRLMEGDMSKSYSTCLKESILAPALANGDVFRASIAHWIREDYQDALGVLCQQAAPPVGGGKADEEPAEFPAAIAWEVMKYISNRPVLKRAGLSNEQYTGMIRVAVGAALNYSQSGQHVLGIQILDSLVKWDRYHMIQRPEVNVYFTVSIMYALADAAIKQMTDDATAQMNASKLGEASVHEEIDCPLLGPIRMLCDVYGLEQAPLIDTVSSAAMRKLQFGLVREIDGDDTEALPASPCWSILETMVASSTVCSLQPISGYSQQVGSLCSAVRVMHESGNGENADMPPAAAVGCAVLVGSFACAWHGQDYVAMCSLLFPTMPLGAADKGWDLATSDKVKAINFGTMLMLMLARLGFAVDGRVSGVPANRGLEVAESARRRVWCWYTQVKSVLSALDTLSDMQEGDAKGQLPTEADGLFPTAPEVPSQQTAAVALWSALLADEQASHKLTERACGGDVVQKLLSAEADAAGVDGLSPVELYKVSKDLPFRAFCVNAAAPTMIAIASNRTIQEVSIRGVLRRYGNVADLQGIAQGRTAKCLLTRERKVNTISPHPRDSLYATGAVEGGRIELWRFKEGRDDPIAAQQIDDTTARISRVHFNSVGSKLGAVDSGGVFSLFTTDDATGITRLQNLPCHNRSASDFGFLNAGSVVATVGNSSDRRNLCIFVRPLPSLLPPFTCFAFSLSVSPMCARVSVGISYPTGHASEPPHSRRALS